MCRPGARKVVVYIHCVRSGDLEIEREIYPGLRYPPIPSIPPPPPLPLPLRRSTWRVVHHTIQHWPKRTPHLPSALAPHPITPSPVCKHTSPHPPTHPRSVASQRTATLKTRNHPPSFNCGVSPLRSFPVHVHRRTANDELASKLGKQGFDCYPRTRG